MSINAEVRIKSVFRSHEIYKINLIVVLWFVMSCIVEQYLNSIVCRQIYLF